MQSDDLQFTFDSFRIHDPFVERFDLDGQRIRVVLIGHDAINRRIRETHIRIDVGLRFRTEQRHQRMLDLRRTADRVFTRDHVDQPVHFIGGLRFKHLNQLTGDDR